MLPESQRAACKRKWTIYAQIQQRCLRKVRCSAGDDGTKCIKQEADLYSIQRATQRTIFTKKGETGLRWGFALHKNIRCSLASNSGVGDLARVLGDVGNAFETLHAAEHTELVVKALRTSCTSCSTNLTPLCIALCLLVPWTIWPRGTSLQIGSFLLVISGVSLRKAEVLGVRRPGRPILQIVKID